MFSINQHTSVSIYIKQCGRVDDAIHEYSDRQMSETNEQLLEILVTCRYQNDKQNIKPNDKMTVLC